MPSAEPPSAGTRSGPATRGLSTLRALFRVLLALESLTTAGVGLWLLWVLATVLPTRDPAHIPMWRTVTACLFAYSGLCWACVANDARAALLRGAVMAASVVAVAAGLYGAIRMIMGSAADGHFEGYVVLMGLVLAGHGVTGLIYPLVAGATRDGPASTC